MKVNEFSVWEDTNFEHTASRRDRPYVRVCRIKGAKALICEVKWYGIEGYCSMAAPLRWVSLKRFGDGARFVKAPYPHL